METELQLFTKVQRYLEGLGYPGSTILFEYKTPNNGFADIVVKTNEGVLIVIEVKNRIPFDKNDREEIGFHPITRQLQKYAQILETAYYIVSDGYNHIWLKTGLNGRPVTIAEKPFTELGVSELSETSFISEVLEHTSEYLRNYSITGDLLFDLSIVFYLKLTQELDTKTNLSLHELLNTEFREVNYDRIPKIEKIVSETLFRLESVSFMKNKDTVLLFVSELFQKNRREWIIPRWVADLMVKVLDCKKSQPVLDMITRYGMLMTAGYRNGLSNVTSFYTNPKELYWIKIQKMLLTEYEDNVFYHPEIITGDLIVDNLPRVDGLLLAPPFNIKLEANHSTKLSSIGIKDSTSLFLELGLNAISGDGRLVAIVPDGFLLSSAYKKARHYFKNHAYIETIISLPQDAFAPFAAVKTSIISICRKSNNNNKPCFLAALDEFTKEVKLDISSSEDALTIVSNLNAFRLNKNFVHSKLGIVENELDVENFHFTKYWFQSHYGNRENLQDGFVPIPLKELLRKIIRGSQLVADKGNMPYIGPAAIRSMQLIEEEFSYTSNEKLPKSVNTVSENDIIINAIGSHRGSAAVIQSNLEGTPINRHVILLKANTDMVIPGYLAVALNSKYVQDQFFDKSTGTVIPALNTKTFEEIYIPVPNLSHQKKIYDDYLLLLNELNEAESVASKLKSRINQNLNILGKGENKS